MGKEKRGKKRGKKRGLILGTCKIKPKHASDEKLEDGTCVMPPCEVEVIACGPCSFINLDMESPRGKRPGGCLEDLYSGRGESIETVDNSLISKSKFGARAVPYKKRKVKKTVKFSPASVFRVVECVSDDCCDSSEDDTVPSSGSLNHSPLSSTSAPGADDTHDDVSKEPHGLVADEQGLDSGLETPSRTMSRPADGASPSSQHVLHEHNIETKDGDGPSTIGLICNALIMGLVDRSITDAETALSVMRAVMKDGHLNSSSLTCKSWSPCTTEITDGDNMQISNRIFEAVLDRLEQLVEHLVRHDRVGLLPSTARLGKPFIPALKCLQGTIRLAMEQHTCVDAKEEEGVEDDPTKTPSTPKSLQTSCPPSVYL